MTSLYVLRTDLDENPVPDEDLQFKLQARMRDIVIDAMLVIDEITKKKPRKK